MTARGSQAPPARRTSDQGLLGPESVAWKVIGHPVALVGGLRSLIVQSLHPLAMAGVAQHSDYKRRPLDRLRRTAHYVAATTFGDTETAVKAAARVRRVHMKVRGTDPVTGLPYSADDPETQVWVHAVEWHSFLAAYRTYAGKLTEEEQDRYLAEGVRIAELLGTPGRMVPASVAEYREYFESVRPFLRISEQAEEAIAFVLRPPLTRDLLAVQVPLRVTSSAALATVPRHLRAMAGIDRPSLLDGVTVAAVRPAAAAIALPVLRDAPALVLGRRTHDIGVAARRGLRDAA